MNKLLIAALALTATPALAQSGTNSPYSMFGLGKLADQAQGFNKSMGGVGVALREHNQVNYTNPASYSALDSLTFIFDVGMSLQNTNFKENGASKNAKTANFDYAVGAFRLIRNVGMSFGIMPYTNVGYSFAATTTGLSDYTPTGSNATGVTSAMSYSGSGGLHQLYVGAGWQTPLRGLSVGANVGYLWGEIYNSSTSAYSDATIASLSKHYTASVHNYKVDLGAQYTHSLPKGRSLTAGLTFSPGHNLGADADMQVISARTVGSLAVNDTTTFTAGDAYALPTQIALGLSYRDNARWLLAADYTWQRWSKADMPVATSQANGSTTSYVASTDVLSDRHRLALGGQYCKDEMGRHYTDRIRYRFGASYSTPYVKINGHDGPREIALSAGLGLPIQNSWNNRSTLNIGVQWQNYKASNFVTENTLMITLGMTFNERWFAKWRFE